MVLAVQAYFKAKEKNLPGLFWAVKSFILGGIAFYEISVARDPNELNEEIKRRNDPSDRRSQNRDSSPLTGRFRDEMTGKK